LEDELFPSFFRHRQNRRPLSIPAHDNFRAYRDGSNDRFCPIDSATARFDESRKMAKHAGATTERPIPQTLNGITAGPLPHGFPVILSIVINATASPAGMPQNRHPNIRCGASRRHGIHQGFPPGTSMPSFSPDRIGLSCFFPVFPAGTVGRSLFLRRFCFFI